MSAARQWFPIPGSFNHRAIEYLAKFPGQTFSLSEICTALGCDAKTSYGQLNRAVKGGVLKSERKGRLTCFGTAEHDPSDKAKPPSDSAKRFTVSLGSDGQLFVVGSTPKNGGFVLNKRQSKKLYEYLQHCSPIFLGRSASKPTPRKANQK